LLIDRLFPTVGDWSTGKNSGLAGLKDEVTWTEEEPVNPAHRCSKPANDEGQADSILLAPF
jgi:hypothetical protein